jgi:hypothetical protein
MTTENRRKALHQVNEARALLEGVHGSKELGRTGASATGCALAKLDVAAELLDGENNDNGANARIIEGKATISETEQREASQLTERCRLLVSAVVNQCPGRTTTALVEVIDNALERIEQIIDNAEVQS